MTTRGVPPASSRSTKARMNAEPWPRSSMSGSPMNWSMPRVPAGCGPKPLFQPAAGRSIADRRTAARRSHTMNWSIVGSIEIAADQLELLVADRPTTAATCGAPSQRRTSGRSAGGHRAKLIRRRHRSGGLQRLDRDVAVGVDADVGRDVERLAHDRLGVERRCRPARARRRARNCRPSRCP